MCGLCSGGDGSRCCYCAECSRSARCTWPSLQHSGGRRRFQGRASLSLVRIRQPRIGSSAKPAVSDTLSSANSASPSRRPSEQPSSHFTVIEKVSPEPRSSSGISSPRAESFVDASVNQTLRSCPKDVNDQIRHHQREDSDQSSASDLCNDEQYTSLIGGTLDLHHGLTMTHTHLQRHAKKESAEDRPLKKRQPSASEQGSRKRTKASKQECFVLPKWLHAHKVKGDSLRVNP